LCAPRVPVASEVLDPRSCRARFALDASETFADLRQLDSQLVDHRNIISVTRHGLGGCDRLGLRRLWRRRRALSAAAHPVLQVVTLDRLVAVVAPGRAQLAAFD